MLKEFFTLEVRNHLKQPMVYIFFVLLGVMAFFATYSDNVILGGDAGNVNRNSPFIIAQFTATLSIFSILIITAFMDFASLRDYRYNYHQILFSTPIRKGGYLFGRFLGAFLISLIPFLGLFLGSLVGSVVPGVNEEVIGPLMPNAYLNSFLIFALPNSFFLSAIIFFLAVRFKSTTVSFIGATVILIGYVTAGVLSEDLDNETLVVIIDALGINSYETVTKYWTVAEKDTRLIPLAGGLLLNRALWIGIGVVFLLLTYVTFSFSEKRKRSRTVSEEAPLTPGLSTRLSPLPPVQLSTGLSARWLQFLSQVRLEFLGTVRSNPFIILMFIGVINMALNAWFITEKSDNSITYPVTYAVIDTLSSTIGLFELIIIIYFTGVMVWKEREAKMNEFFDAYAYPDGIMLGAKLVALVGLVATIQLLVIAVGIAVQLLHGYTDIDLSLYFVEVFLVDFPRFIMLIIFSVSIQLLVNNKFVGYAAVVGLFVFNALILPTAFDIRHNLLIFRGQPDYTYSDMSGYGPFVTGMFWFNFYWLLFSGLLVIVSLLFWVRGRERSFKSRLRTARQRFTPTLRRATLAMVTLWVLVGGFIFYNTNILNDYTNPEDRKALQAEYEQQYKQYEGVPQPRITAVQYNIDLEPYERNLYATATMTLKNKTKQPIDSLHLSYTTRPVRLQAVQLKNATLLMDDSLLGYRIYRLSPALQPGDSLQMVTTSAYESRGFENEVSFHEVSQNGSFFNAAYLVPTVGYRRDAEITDRDDREDFDLPERARMAAIDDTAAYANHYIAADADWIRTETTISTAPDQVAVAPGALVEEWEEDGKRYFRYQVEQPILHFTAFISARYEVLRDKWQDVDVEIYYHPQHAYNVARMAEAVKASLAYYTEHFSPYPHQYARIIEFPRYTSFAQAFPGTMPYSESIGFIENLEAKDSKDRVLHTVAHEMAHQWWGHQVVGANVQGATMLSETMAQYASLMVMKHERSEKSTAEYRRYEVDRYLRSRGSEERKEVPLSLVEDMGYVHYQKGSNVMYALQDYIGEERINQALRTYAQEVAYQEPPYTTSRDLLAHFRAVTPDSLQSFVTDLFEHITLYSNRTEEATYEALDDGKYQVNLKVVSQKFYADSLGAESEVPINDWIDIGVYTEDTSGEDSLIYLDRRKITDQENTFQITVDREPTKAGIDPNALLIDRVPDDNVKKLTKEGAEAIAEF